MKKLLLLAIIFLGGLSFNQAQTIEELKDAKKVKEDSISAIQGRVDDLQSQIDTFPGWKFGVFGTIGANLSGFNNWYAQGTPNNSAGNITITANPHAKLDREKDFWYTTANINLGWVKFDDEDDPTDDDSFREATDVFNIQSLYGYKISKHLAVSTLGEYRTTIIRNFNDPGYLDLGVGITWTPIENLIVVVHPLNYNFVFADNDAVFDSSLGAKVVANYAKEFGDLKFNSNLSAFMSYKDSDLSNWTWINSLSYTFWKGIGLGFELGLRDNKQEAFNNLVNSGMDFITPPTFDDVDNKLQSYWTFGLSYKF